MTLCKMTVENPVEIQVYKEKSNVILSENGAMETTLLISFQKEKRS